LPVVVYVAPDGASAGSAGVFITLAGDVAAMAPQTNIGSATPVLIGPRGPAEASGDLRRKAQNDLAAYARALAEGRGRNARLAERMVRQSVNVTAGTARRERLIDVVAGSERALLRRLDGFRIRGRKAQVLHTDGLRVVRSQLSEPADTGIDESADGGLLFGLSPGLVGLIMLAGATALMLLRRFLLRP
ncbi:MAG: NfeD family protein, partial [Gammaproteobacteria bacterium]